MATTIVTPAAPAAQVPPTAAAAPGASPATPSAPKAPAAPAPVPAPAAAAPAPDPLGDLSKPDGEPAAAPKVEPKAPDPAKPTDAKGDAAAAKPPAETTPPAEPVFDLKLAEGSLLSPDVDVPAVIEFAKAEKLTPELAAKVLTQRDEAVKSFAASENAKVKAAVEKWPEMLLHDKEIGGEKLPGVLEDCKRYIQEFGDDEMRAVLNSTGLGNAPPFVRMIARAARPRRDDVLADGKTTGAGPDTRSDGEVLFPMSELGPADKGDLEF